MSGSEFWVHSSGFRVPSSGFTVPVRDLRPKKELRTRNPELKTS